MNRERYIVVLKPNAQPADFKEKIKHVVPVISVWKICQILTIMANSKELEFLEEFKEVQHIQRSMKDDH